MPSGRSWKRPSAPATAALSITGTPRETAVSESRVLDSGRLMPASGAGRAEGSMPYCDRHGASRRTSSAGTPSTSTGTGLRPISGTVPVRRSTGAAQPPWASCV